MKADSWGCEDNLLTASVTWSTCLPEQGLWGQPVATITGALHALQLVSRFHSHGGLSLCWVLSVMACLVACLMACCWPAWWPAWWPAGGLPGGLPDALLVACRLPQAPWPPPFIASPCHLQADAHLGAGTCSGLQFSVLRPEPKGTELQALRTLAPKCLWCPSLATKTTVPSPLIISPLGPTVSLTLHTHTTGSILSANESDCTSLSPLVAP